MVVLGDEESEEEVERPTADPEQTAGWTSNESDEEPPSVLPYRERHQTPTFHMIVGREYRMVRSTGTDAPAKTQSTVPSTSGPRGDHNYQMQATIPITPFAERVR